MFDVEDFRLPCSATTVPSSGKPQRFRKGEKFLRGPIPWAWLSVAARLPGKALAVALVIWHLAGFKNTTTIELSRVPLKSLGVSRQAAYRGLKKLENAALVKAERHSGRKTRVTILSIGGS
jgi:hypothetical protein